MNKIINDDCTEIPDHYSESMHQLIYMLLSKDPEKRPTISKIIQAPEIMEEVSLQCAWKSNNFVSLDPKPQIEIS